jgi:hypothetical protein
MSKRGFGLRVAYAMLALIAHAKTGSGRMV